MCAKIIPVIFFLVLFIKTRGEIGPESTNFLEEDGIPGYNNGTEIVNRDTSSQELIKNISNKLTILQDIYERNNIASLRIDLSLHDQKKKFSGMRNSTIHFGNKIDELSEELKNTKANLDVLKQHLVNLRQSQNQIRKETNKAAEAKLALQKEIRKDISSTIINEEIKNKLLVLTPSIHSILGSIGLLQNDLFTADGNLTVIHGKTGQMMNLTNEIPTMNDFLALLPNADKNSKAPATVLLPPNDVFMHTPEWFIKDNKENFPQDCADLLLSPDKYQKYSSGYKSGVYLIQPWLSSRPFFVYCDMETDGGGWTVFQNRYEGAIDFYREWIDYKYGFGNVAGEFWLGLEKLHLLTNYKVNEILIQLEDFEDNQVKAKYSAFAIGSETEGYHISLLGDYSGDAGDSFSVQAGQKFSTHDLDQDSLPAVSCAKLHQGAWWYGNCGSSNLNGKYNIEFSSGGVAAGGMTWNRWHGPQYSMKRSRMAVRPRMHKSTIEKERELLPIDNNPIPMHEEDEDYLY